MNYIDKVELEACLLSRRRLSSLVSLLPTSEYDLWVREMTVSGLDFRNPIGAETFNWFKRVCIIERNSNESSNLLFQNTEEKEVHRGLWNRAMK